MLQERKASIEDRITTVIRSADPAHLAEPGLETLKRQFKFELDKITEDETLIRQVLIPKLLQTRSAL
jgi:flagellar basal body-associated protein FliL